MDNNANANRNRNSVPRCGCGSTWLDPEDRECSDCKQERMEGVAR